MVLLGEQYFCEEVDSTQMSITLFSFFKSSNFIVKLQFQQYNEQNQFNLNQTN